MLGSHKKASSPLCPRHSQTGQTPLLSWEGVSCHWLGMPMTCLSSPQDYLSRESFVSDTALKEPHSQPDLIDGKIPHLEPEPPTTLG